MLQKKLRELAGVLALKFRSKARKLFVDWKYRKRNTYAHAGINVGKQR